MNNQLVGFLGIDQYGKKYWLNKPKFPRNQLLQLFGSTYTKKMYVDTKNGKTKHIGYIIDDYWIKIYKIFEWEGKA